MQATVRRALAQVPERFAALSFYRDLEGLSYEEVAEVLEVSVGTVKSRILRGRRLLKEILDPLVRAPERNPLPLLRSSRACRIPRSVRAALPSAIIATRHHIRASHCLPSLLKLPHGRCEVSDELPPGRTLSPGISRRRDFAAATRHGPRTPAACEDCNVQLERFRRLAVCLANVAPAAPPADLAVRIRVRAAQSGAPWADVRRCGLARSSRLKIF